MPKIGVLSQDRRTLDVLRERDRGWRHDIKADYQEDGAAVEHSAQSGVLRTSKARRLGILQDSGGKVNVLHGKERCSGSPLVLSSDGAFADSGAIHAI